MFLSSIQGDFASLVVADGRLEFRFDTGSGDRDVFEIRIKNTKKHITSKFDTKVTGKTKNDENSKSSSSFFPFCAHFFGGQIVRFRIVKHDCSRHSSAMQHIILLRLYFLQSLS